MEKNPKVKGVLTAALNIVSIILLGLVLQIGGAYLVNAAVNIMGELDEASSVASAALQYNDFMEYIRTIEPKQFANVIFVAPLIEEIVFRLIFLRAGKMVLPFWAANLIQAALFGLYHTVTIQRVYGFVIGLVIGCVFYYCPIVYRSRCVEDAGKSLRGKEGGLSSVPDSLIGVATTFLLHVVINAAGIFIAPLLPADLPYSLQIIIGSVFMLIAFAAAYALYVISRKGNNTNYHAEVAG